MKMSIDTKWNICIKFLMVSPAPAVLILMNYLYPRIFISYKVWQSIYNSIFVVKLHKWLLSSTVA